MNKMNSAPIGVFDSGVGGLSVIREMLHQMPEESFIYYADTAHVPYGPRQQWEIREFALSITSFLLEQGCKMIIVACNTTNSLAYDVLTSRYDVPFVGVIEPGVNKALNTTQNGRIGVIATEATTKSGYYQQMLLSKNPLVHVEAKACPLLVPLIEKGMVDSEEVRQAARQYLQPLKDSKIDTLILGCTHYPFILPVIQEVLGPAVNYIDPAHETVKQALQILKDHNLHNHHVPGGKACPSYRYYASGDPDSFAQVAGAFLKKDIGRVEKISLD